MNKIIYAHGQMCNQFWVISNYIADSIETKEVISVWAPSYDITHFPRLNSTELVKYPLGIRQIIRYFGFPFYIKYIFPILKSRIGLAIAKLIVKLIPNTIFITKDVTYMESINRKKYLAQIKDIFTPNELFSKNLKLSFLSKRNEFDCLVGIHIRYGDYRTYNNGKYFYQLNEYRSVMEKTIKLLGDKNKVVFFLTSNEKIDYTAFKGMNYFFNEKSNAISDMLGLSLCDYIIGPPSSYSAWASLYNHIPIYFIENLNEIISKENFIHIENLWFA